jgi:Na+/H+ antiporter NhaD/arsenite permease-like protein
MHPEIGTLLSAWWTVPFAGMLLSIALFPLFAPHFWHHHYPKVTAFWAVALAAPFLFFHRGEATHHLLEVVIGEYIPFLVLLFGLYTVTSGILVRGSLRGTPGQNVLILAIGGAVASWVGTTGASIVLIRPLIRAISHRQHRAHTIVFFIFIVSNAGGLLTPIGDPPLFLGFLQGVPFFWTLHLFPIMLTVILPLLAIYYAIDRRYYRREPARTVPLDASRPGIGGWQNIGYLLVVVGSVVASGMIDLGDVTVLGIEHSISGLLRELVIVTVAVISLKTTSADIHHSNQFSWGPIKEVAILFAGIFITMIPALAILRAGEQGALRGLIELAREPRDYFWLSGGLSSFLDNAPTYLTFLNTAMGALEPGKEHHAALAHLLTTHAAYLQAISCGAVFMGANTYIGNAPNFMVKSIAEEAGIEMPSFFGFMLKYSVPFLIPLFLLVTVLFFSG